MSSLRFLFAAAVFWAAFLLFLVEPMAAKQLLPILGGSASVWITCLVFFQTALLIGYLYAHWLTRRPRPAAYRITLGLALAGPLAWILRELPVSGLRQPYPDRLPHPRSHHRATVHRARRHEPASPGLVGADRRH